MFPVFIPVDKDHVPLLSLGALVDVSEEEWFVMLFCFMFWRNFGLRKRNYFKIGWWSSYFILGYIGGFAAWGLKTASFIMGNFVGLLYFLIVVFLQEAVN